MLRFGMGDRVINQLLDYYLKITKGDTDHFWPWLEELGGKYVYTLGQTAYLEI